MLATGNGKKKYVKKNTAGSRYFTLLAGVLSLLFLGFNFIAECRPAYKFIQEATKYNRFTFAVIEDAKKGLFSYMQTSPLKLLIFLLFALLLIFLCWLWGSVIGRQEEPILSFNSENDNLSDSTTVHSVILKLNGNEVKEFKLTKYRFFIEDLGCIMVYKYKNEKIEWYTNYRFDTAVIMKSDGTVLAELKYDKDKWIVDQTP